MTKQPVCPRCSAPMVLRVAKKGIHKGNEFYGCKKFPYCKGTREAPKEHLVPTNQVSTADTPSKIPAQKPGTPLTEAQRRELIRLRDRLFDLTSKNRSLRLSRLDMKWAFDLSLLNGFGNGHTKTVLGKCLAESGEFDLLPKLTDDNQKLWQDANNRLSKLDRAITEIHREKGLYDLFVGFPFLSGIPLNSEVVLQAPIFLIPVRLEKHTAHKGASNWRLTRPKDLPIAFNKTLFYGLVRLCNLKINEQIFEEDPPEDPFGTPTMLEWTNKLLAQYGIPASLDPSVSMDLRPLQEFLLRELPKTFVPGSLRLTSHAVLGHFPQSNSSIQKDYEKFLTSSQEEIEPITCFLSEAFRPKSCETTQGAVITEINARTGSGEKAQIPSTVDQRSEKDNFYLLPSDSSQDRILMTLREPSTRGVVIWGPPGTGKSQTIVNIIGDCIYRGKTVLFVSQKRAALDVVYKRLGMKGLTSLTAIVHDARNDRKALYQHIEKLTTSSQSQLIESPIDPSPEIQRITEQLQSVHKAYNDNMFGRPLGELYRQSRTNTSLSFKLDSKWLAKKVTDIEPLLESIRTYQGQRQLVKVNGLLRKRLNFSSLTREHKDAVRESLLGVCQSDRLQEALKLLRVCKNGGNGRPPSGNSERITTYLKHRAQVEDEKGVSKYFKPSYWKLILATRNIVSSSEAEVEQAKRTVSRSLQALLERSAIDSLVNKFLDFSIEMETLTTFLEDLDNNFDGLKGLDITRMQMPEELRALVPQFDAIDSENSVNQLQKWDEAFRHSVFKLWIAELEKKHAVISLVRSGEVDRLRIRYKELLEQKRNYCAAIARKKVQEGVNTPDAVESKKRVFAQVTKSRRIPSIRNLNDEFFGNRSFRSLLPVWLTSPEAVSDAIPFQKGAFDVVIFDEASQCPVENGLPAVYRGKQVVIAGDEKQLPPNRLFDAQIDEAEDDEIVGPATDEPSFLSLAKKTLRYESLMLEWHYRSKHEELISFSNQAFYLGHIKIAPNVRPFGPGNTPGISWHRVNGFWEERTNREEAQKVIELIRSYLLDPSAPSIGVITFNISQKELILDELEKAQASDPDLAACLTKDKERSIDEQLFVKNIENVQGDEREVIIFSVAYAPAHPGGRVNQWFGVLNQQRTTGDGPRKLGNFYFETERPAERGLTHS